MENKDNQKTRRTWRELKGTKERLTMQEPHRKDRNNAKQNRVEQYKAKQNNTIQNRT